jgi:hypothetical protein
MSKANKKEKAVVVNAVAPVEKITKIRANKMPTTIFPLTAKITVVNKANPHRTNPMTLRAEAFNFAVTCKSVNEYVEKGKGKGYKFKYLGRWVAMGLIKIA